MSSSRNRIHLETIAPYVNLYRDAKTGIAWVEDGRSGNGHSCHPNISASGSVRGMKARGYWGKHDRTVRSHGFIYNIDHCSGRGERGDFDDLTEIARQHCRCGGVH